MALRKKGAKVTYLDDLNAEDEATTSPAKLSRPRWRELGPAQIDKYVAVLATFNDAMQRYLTEQAKRATSGPRDLTGDGREQSDDQGARSAWRQR